MAVKPKLALIPSGVKANKVYSVLPADGVGDFDFSRSGSATRINKDGLIEMVDADVPRLNYPIIDGVVSGCPSLLLEPARTNLLQYSEDFSQSYWNKASSTVTLTSEISPNGTTDSVYNLTGTSANLYVGGTTGVEHTISFYIKSNGQGKDKFKLRLGNNTSIEYTATNEWVRYEYTETPTTSVFGITTASAPNNEFDLLIWGAQVEAGSYPTSYIPSLSNSQTTRSAETCNNSGDANTFNDSEGVLMLEAVGFDSGVSSSIYIGDGGTSNRMQIVFHSSGEIRSFITGVNGGNTTVFSSGILNYDSFHKVVISYSSSAFEFWIDGFKIDFNNSDYSFNSGELTELNFDVNGSENFYGNTKQIQYFDTALNDTDLETLTSWTSFNEMAESQLYSVY